jgi:hypothetical protein
MSAEEEGAAVAEMSREQALFAANADSETARRKVEMQGQLDASGMRGPQLTAQQEHWEIERKNEVSGSGRGTPVRRDAKRRTLRRLPALWLRFGPPPHPQ